MSPRAASYDRLLSDVRPDWIAPDAPGLAIPLPELSELFVDALEVLAAQHLAGSSHGDIKPSNIGVTSEGAIEILNPVGDFAERGTIRGTPLYMSPEQAHGEEPSAASDVFSFGLTVYQVLTGRSAYDSSQVDVRHASDVLEFLGHLKFSGGEFDLKFPPEVPGGLRRVVRRACRMDAAARYTDARAMADDWRRALLAQKDFSPWTFVQRLIGRLTRQRS